MKNGDFYRHFKGGEYYFDCIALPLKDIQLRRRLVSAVAESGVARYHEDTHDLALYNFDGVAFIDSNVPHVIYQAERDYDTDFVYAREVNDFFGYKEGSDGSFVKRFSLMKNGI